MEEVIFNLSEELSRFQRQNWIFLLSLIVQYEQNNNNDIGKQFWNWCIKYHKPDGFNELE